MISKVLNRVWYRQRPPNFLLRWLEGFYARGLDSQKAKGLAELATDLQDYPIIVVGNITAGGTGKTPLTMRLVELLKNAGIQVGIVSRGYGRQSKLPILITPDTSPAEGGDEPVLMAARCQVPVMVDSDREAAARALFNSGVQVVVADDGLQRWRMPRDIELCVIDAERGLGNGHLLPAGPLREPASRLERVDQVVLNGRSQADDYPGAVIMETWVDDFHSLDGASTSTAIEMAERCAGRKVCAVAGIGSPGRFFRQLESLGITISREMAFDDHHNYKASDFKGIGEAIILMTEKDAVKCRNLPMGESWFLRISARLPAAWEEAFVARVKALLEEKRT